jgi:hypothetical protein
VLVLRLVGRAFKLAMILPLLSLIVMSFPYVLKTLEAVPRFRLPAIVKAQLFL